MTGTLNYSWGRRRAVRLGLCVRTFWSVYNHVIQEDGSNMETFQALRFRPMLLTSRMGVSFVVRMSSGRSWGAKNRISLRQAQKYSITWPLMTDLDTPLQRFFRRSTASGSYIRHLVLNSEITHSSWTHLPSHSFVWLSDTINSREIRFSSCSSHCVQTWSKLILCYMSTMSSSG